MQTIDLNCDMGEGAGHDADIMPYISSANIACGFHTGGEDTMKKTVELALQYGIAVGVHPGFADKENFGRTEKYLPLAEVYDLVSQQIYSLQKIAHGMGATMHHVKPHGALYNMAAKDSALADVIAKAVKDADGNLVLYGLYNSFLISAAGSAGLRCAAEVFADRRYDRDGNLVARKLEGALIENEADAIKQVLRMVLNNEVNTVEGLVIKVHPQTICLHGDGVHAPAFAKKIHAALLENGIVIKRR